MSEYRRNHYVPVWYQHRFFSDTERMHRLYSLNLHPEILISSSGYKYREKEIELSGPNKCFCIADLYTTRYFEWESTDIEKFFFGKIDSDGKKAIEFFSEFDHTKIDHDAYYNFIRFLSVQKLRTPKGLDYIRQATGSIDKNSILINLQRLKDLHIAIWSECIWSIVKASNSGTKFILSDHPVTVYNMGCFPGSDFCVGSNDPEIWLNGTHTIFPLDMNTALILTNLSWLRNPYSSPLRKRPNPEPFRDAFFNFCGIQIKRELDDIEVASINYIIKKRAFKYIAAMQKEWLYPENILPKTKWNEFGKQFLLMPDPRSCSYTTGVLGRFEDGRSFSVDEYGRPGRQTTTANDYEFLSFHAFIGEYARKFGPKRRGVSNEYGRIDNAVDSEDTQRHNIKNEGYYKSKMKMSR